MAIHRSTRPPPLNASPVIPPPPELTDLCIRAFDDHRGGSLFRCRAVNFGTGGSRYSSNHDGVYDEDVNYGLDDEMVPWSERKKVKTDRMKKVGKISTAAKPLYPQLKRGCIHGKHGLGIRFRC